MPQQLSLDDQARKLERNRKIFTVCQWSAGIFAAIVMAGCLYLGKCGWGEKIDRGGVKIIQERVLVFWTLAPPIWFWVEYIFLFRRAFPDASKDKLEELKTQQDLSSKIWIASASVLLILYFWKDIGK